MHHMIVCIKMYFQLMIKKIKNLKLQLKNPENWFLENLLMELKIMMGVGMAPQTVITRTFTATLQPKISSKGWLTQRSQKSVTAVMNAISMKMI